MLPWPVEMGWLPITTVGCRVIDSDGGKDGKLLLLVVGVGREDEGRAIATAVAGWPEKTMIPPDLLDLPWSETREKMGGELVAVVAEDGEDVMRLRRNGTCGLAAVLLDILSSN
ncbi:hypothetical protein ACLOJK_014394 [Asimina triloba]